MAILLQQTSTTDPGIPGQACSTITEIAQAVDFRLVAPSGTPGGNNTVILDSNLASGNPQSSCHFYSGVGYPGLLAWTAGNWVVRLNVQTGNANITWDDTWICRVNSSLVSQATVGSLTGQATSLASTGVKTHTVSGALQAASAGDRVYIVIGLSNASASDENVTFTFDQLITTPLSQPSLVVGSRTSNLIAGRIIR